MGAQRSSIRVYSMVAAGALEMDVVDGHVKLMRLVRDDGDDEWLAASTSLGLPGVIVRMKFNIYPDSKVYAHQKTLEEKDVLDGDIYDMIAPYVTANLWWWPCKRRFHHRYYDVVPTNASAREGFQNTFSVTDLEETAARTLLDSGRYLATSNVLDFPSFRPKVGDHTRFNEPFYHNLAMVLVDEFPCRPHWTKNTSEVFAHAVKNIDPRRKPANLPLIQKLGFFVR
ncbi:hypothetical protein CDEST_07870 [Colletotrichum destructivum]|uniref:Uncharacterized protein n=1 Tax=Colletotrichum destructivum TaxID=34406 RepID=A0AAX4IIT2_9PEZI|nr:hypothetical protein CDEST_07870 [Colletotrichum destructivum]